MVDTVTRRRLIWWSLCVVATLTVLSGALHGLIAPPTGLVRTESYRERRRPNLLNQAADPRGSDVRVRVSRPNQFKVIDLTQEPWPLYVRGTVEAGGLQPVGLAVAMNGRVAATTESYMEGGEWVFATVLPEEYLRHGTNDLQVFLIDDNAGSLVLRSTFSRRRDRDRRRRAPSQPVVEVPLHSTAMHPAPRRCSSVKYSRYFPSSRLAGWAPRRPRCHAGLSPRAARNSQPHQEV